MNDVLSFNSFCDAAIANNRTAMMAMLQVSHIALPTDGSPVTQDLVLRILREGWDALSAAQQSTIAAEVLAPAYMAGSSAGPGAIDGDLFAAIVSSGPGGSRTGRSASIAGTGNPVLRLPSQGTPRGEHR